MNICDADKGICQDTRTAEPDPQKDAIDMREIMEDAITMITDAAYSMAPVIKLRVLKESSNCKQ